MFKRIRKKNKPFVNKKEIILRDYLAIERTKLANERTFFAYIRTSIYLLLAGIAFIQLKEFDNIKWLGLVSFILSVLFFLFGFVRYYQRLNRLKRYYNKQESIKKNQGTK